MVTVNTKQYSKLIPQECHEMKLRLDLCLQCSFLSSSLKTFTETEFIVSLTVSLRERVKVSTN